MLDNRKLRLLESRVDALKRTRRDADRRKTYDEVFDETTLLAIYKVISDGILHTVDYPVSTGKEGNVFHATTPDREGVALKIYRINTATFRSVAEYIEGDRRFRRVGKSFRERMGVWAQKEFRNLRAMRDAGARVPEPRFVHENLLVMEYVGDETMPAPAIRTVELEDPEAAYGDLVASMAAIRRAGLVHGDLSEFNILWWGGAPWVIDCAQGVPLDHHRADEWFRRDVGNVARFFSRLGVRTDAAGLEARLRGG